MPGKSARTKEFIITKTAPLFNRQGFSGTSMLDLTAATGLTKGALYGNFENKESIALAVLKYSMDIVREKARAHLDNERSNKEKLLKLFTFFGEYVEASPIPGGCPMINNAVEADDHQVFLKKAVSEEINRTIDFIAKLLEEGKRHGEFVAEARSRALAQTFFCAIEGAIVMSRVTSSAAPMRAVLKHCHSILNQISL